MKSKRERRIGAVLLSAWAVVSAEPARTRAADEIEGVTAVDSRASADYVRSRLPDGSFGPEAYAFGDGGVWGGEIRDETIDKLRFRDLAGAIAKPLASQNYVPAQDPKSTKLLIMVYWGTTQSAENATDTPAYLAAQDLSNKMRGMPGNSSGKPSFASSSAMEAAMLAVQMENQQRDKVDRENAALLGYNSWWDATRQFQNTGFGLAYERQDMIDELERARYFVILIAYDFQLLWKEKKHKELWEARFSIDERHNQFDRALPVMAQYASQYFGQDSKGLQRTRVPEGRVDIGEVKNLGEAPQK